MSWGIQVTLQKVARTTARTICTPYFPQKTALLPYPEESFRTAVAVERIFNTIQFTTMLKRP
jgi:hypothetical protein